MYEDYAFGSSACRVTNRPLSPLERTPPLKATNLAQRRSSKWLSSVRLLLDDSELEKERLTNWGEPYPHEPLSAL
jgi:hypothetical protein